MFKKINSNHESNTSITEEIRKEFTKYFDKAENKGRVVLDAYPRQIFMGMVILIAFSAIMCFVISTPNKQQKTVTAHFERESYNNANLVSDGVAETYKMGEKVINLIALRKQVETILKKPKLTHEDTLFLEEAIKEFEIHQGQPKH